MVCWRMLAFLGAGDARRKRDAAGGGGAVGGFQGGGVMVCRGWLGGGDPAAGPMQAERRAGAMTAGQSPGGGNLRRMAGKT